MKSIIASVITMSTLVSSVVSTPLNNTFAENTPISLGDLYGNGDGLTPSDAIAIQMFLSGNYKVTARQFTAMDVNQDGVVDNTDVDYLLYCISRSINPGTTTRLYDEPYNGTETYLKHTCGTGTASSSTSYVLAAPTATINSNIDDFSLMTLNTPDVPDDTVAGCVKLEMTFYDGRTSSGSGFIVENNVIATAAHCLYDNGFVRNVTAYLHTKEVHNGRLVDVTYKAEAQNVHIPSGYTHNDEYKVNFDFGLMQFGQFSFHSRSDDGSYGNGIDAEDYIIDLGVMSDYFADGYTGNSVTVTGYTSGTSGDTKYSSSGTLISMADISAEYGFRFHSSAIAPPGKSGGVTYFESSANNNTISNMTAVGINTHRNTINLEAYGIRIDPSIIRFLTQNPNI